MTRRTLFGHGKALHLLIFYFFFSETVYVSRLSSVISFGFRMKGMFTFSSLIVSYGLDGPGIESRWGRNFLHPARPAPGAHPASYSPGIKRPGRGVNHPPSVPSWQVIT